PIMRQVLAWAETCELEIITEGKFKQAVGGQLTEEQILVVNAAMWGFLSPAVSGTAETMLKRAEPLNGLDAWRRITRFTEHVRPMRLENLRTEVNQMRQRQVYAALLRNDYDTEAVVGDTRTTSGLTNTRFGSFGVVVPYPVYRGSLVFAAGFNRVKDLDSVVRVRGFSASDSLQLNNSFR
ncbi:MAG: hypothetical protein QF541_25495, partial [Lentisphaeria bacterium]|nr:hypothetical protein [Lentisphaeria bacterium]